MDVTEVQLISKKIIYFANRFNEGAGMNRIGTVVGLEWRLVI